MQGDQNGMMSLMRERKIFVSWARRARSAAIDVLARFFGSYLLFSSYPNSAPELRPRTAPPNCAQETKAEPGTKHELSCSRVLLGHEHVSIAFIRRVPWRASVPLANPAQSQY